MAVINPPIAPPIPINPITPWLFALSECVCNELATTGAGPMCWCGIYPGAQVSLEYCEECSDGLCGMGWVRLVTANPSTSFPIPEVQPNCRAEVAWMIEVGAVRCIPSPEDGAIPPAEDMAMYAADQMQDAHALYRALLCCEAPSMLVQSWTPIGPDGGCLGGTWLAWMAAT